MSYWTELAAFELSSILTPHSHFSQFSVYTDSLFCPQGPDSNGLKEEMVLFHSFSFHLEALAGLRFPSTLKSDNTIK